VEDEHSTLPADVDIRLPKGQHIHKNTCIFLDIAFIDDQEITLLILSINAGAYIRKQSP
jgi:hypothetical protein